MSSNFIKKETSICEYVCGRYYAIDYNHNGYTSIVKGLLLNYYNGNIVLLAENGIYHLKYKDIVFMKPIEPHMDKLSKEFKEMLESFKGDNN